MLAPRASKARKVGRREFRGLPAKEGPGKVRLQSPVDLAQLGNALTDTRKVRHSEFRGSAAEEGPGKVPYNDVPYNDGALIMTGGP